MNPHTYWNSLLIVFSVVTIALILFSFYLLYKIKNEQIFQVTPESKNTPNLINDNLLERVTESFDIKSTNHEKIKSGAYSYKDPSVN